MLFKISITLHYNSWDVIRWVFNCHSTAVLAFDLSMYCCSYVIKNEGILKVDFVLILHKLMSNCIYMRKNARNFKVMFSFNLIKLIMLVHVHVYGKKMSRILKLDFIITFKCFYLQTFCSKLTILHFCYLLVFVFSLRQHNLTL